MKIALVVGHDANNQGAYGNAGKSEFIFNEQLINDLFDKEMIPQQHQVHVFYRSPNIHGYGNKMEYLHSQIDEMGCDVSIEFHFNSFHNPQANGNEVLYCSQGGKRIADIFDAEFDLLPNRDRGVKKVQMNPDPIPDDRGAGFCCRGKSYAIIIEPFFGANQTKYDVDGKYRGLLLTAISNALNKL